eukprot:GHVN01105391.1.p1 GENE.GHVN01105391.1~~GHVN01105391.1.p1  ORF type:complete len:103 (-),score=15.19 GHVN01105391.1:70-378(-)
MKRERCGRATKERALIHLTHLIRSSKRFRGFWYRRNRFNNPNYRYVRNEMYYNIFNRYLLPFTTSQRKKEMRFVLPHWDDHYEYPMVVGQPNQQPQWPSPWS